MVPIIGFGGTSTFERSLNCESIGRGEERGVTQGLINSRACKWDGVAWAATRHVAESPEHVRRIRHLLRLLDAHRQLDAVPIGQEARNGGRLHGGVVLGDPGRHADHLHRLRRGGENVVARGRGSSDVGEGRQCFTVGRRRIGWVPRASALEFFCREAFQWNEQAQPLQL